MANEKRLIDANALADEVDESKHYNPHPQGMIRVNHRNEHDHFLRMIMDAPTVDAVEVVHGYWEKEHDDLGIDRGWKCSHCKGSVYEMTYEPYQYCPHCGAKMDGDGNG